MSVKINDRVIETQYVEYGVLWDDGEATLCDDEAEARYVLSMPLCETGKLAARTVYETAWAEVSE